MVGTHIYRKMDLFQMAALDKIAFALIPILGVNI